MRLLGGSQRLTLRIVQAQIFEQSQITQSTHVCVAVKPATLLYLLNRGVTQQTDLGDKNLPWALGG